MSICSIRNDSRSSSKSQIESTIPPKADRERERLLHRNLRKHYYIEKESRELIGFTLENHAAWIIERYGEPQEVVTHETIATERVVRHFWVSGLWNVLFEDKGMKKRFSWFILR